MTESTTLFSEGTESESTESNTTETETEPTETVNDEATEIAKLIQDTNGPKPASILTAEEMDDRREQALLNLIAPISAMSQWTRCLIYGYQGKGKTTWAMRAPNPLLVAIEVGQKSLLNRADTRNQHMMKFKTVEQVEDFADLLKKGRFPQYETIVLDTFSELEKTVVSNRVYDQFLRVEDRDRYTPEGKDYQNSGEHLRQIAALFRDVERNIVFVCQEKEVEEKTSGKVLIRPDLAPKVINKLGEYCDIIARLTTEMVEVPNSDPKRFEEKFYLTCRASGNRILAKSRIDSLPTVVEGSSFNMVHKLNLKQIREAEENK